MVQPLSLSFRGFTPKKLGGQIYKYFTLPENGHGSVGHNIIIAFIHKHLFITVEGIST